MTELNVIDRPAATARADLLPRDARVRLVRDADLVPGDLVLCRTVAGPRVYRIGARARLRGERLYRLERGDGSVAGWIARTRIQGRIDRA